MNMCILPDYIILTSQALSLWSEHRNVASYFSKLLLQTHTAELNLEVRVQVKHAVTIMSGMMAYSLFFPLLDLSKSLLYCTCT